MSFKEMLARDSAAVFMNLAEFGEEHELAGMTITVVLEEVSDFDSYGNQSFIPPAADPELPRRILVLHCLTSAVPTEAVQGGCVSFDGEPHVVISRHDGLGDHTRLEITRRGYRYA